MDRREMTFSQAEGVEPLPSQLNVGEISAELRAKLWRILYLGLEDTRRNVPYHGYIINDPWEAILRSWHVDRQHKAYDEFNGDFRPVVHWTKSIIQDGSYIDVLDFIQFIIRHRECPRQFEQLIDVTLKRCHAAGTVKANWLAGRGAANCGR